MADKIDARSLRYLGGVEAVQQIIIGELEWFMKSSPYLAAVMGLLKKHMIHAPQFWWMDCDRKALGELTNILVRMTKDEVFMAAEIKRAEKTQSAWMKKKISENEASS